MKIKQAHIVGLLTLIAVAALLFGGVAHAGAATLGATVEETPTPTIPDQMADTHGAKQLIVITGEKLGSKRGTLRLFEYRENRWVEIMKVPARFGYKGLVNGEKRKVGTKTTPTGIWKMPSFAFGTGKKPPKGSKVKWKKITKKSYWTDKKGKKFNTWVTSKKRVSGERLINYKTAYKYAISTGYNAKPNPVVYKRGSCIFIHCYKNAQTAGCISVSAANMKKLVSKIDPKLKPYCAIGTTADPLAPTSIYSY